MTIILLQIIGLILVVMMIKEETLFDIILYFSGFSLLMAGSYFLLRAPDVALAEASIGSAILPLILLITLRQGRKQGGKHG